MVFPIFSPIEINADQPSELMSMKVSGTFILIWSNYCEPKGSHVRPVRLFEEKRYQELMEEQHYLGNSGRG